MTGPGNTMKESNTGSDLSIQEIQKVFDESDLVASLEKVEAGLKKIAAQMNQDYQNSCPLVLTVMNGGLITAGQLLPLLNFPLQSSYIHATRYGDRVKGQGLDWRVRPNLDIGGRDILIVDDIYDEGATIAAIIEECKKYGAHSVKTAMLVDKRHDRKFNPELEIDYVAIEAPDRFLFGFGMDYKGYWRNAPGIYAVKGL